MKKIFLLAAVLVVTNLPGLGTENKHIVVVTNISQEWLTISGKKGFTGTPQAVAAAPETEPNLAQATAFLKKFSLSINKDVPTTITNIDFPKSFATLPWAHYQAASSASGYDLTPMLGRHAKLHKYQLLEAHQTNRGTFIKFAFLVFANNKIVGAWWTDSSDAAPGVRAFQREITPTFKPTLAKVKYAQVRLGYGKKSAVVDLDETPDVTLGGNDKRRFRLFFVTVKDDKIYYLFQVQSGPDFGNPLGYCGGDAPQTLVWLKTDLALRVEEAKSEVFASCAYNGGRYLEGKIRLTASTLRLIFEQQKNKTEITYDNSQPENGFLLKNPPR